MVADGEISRRGKMIRLSDIRLNDFNYKKFLETKAGRITYVALVTVVLSSVGSWAVLAHQGADNPSTKNDTGMTDAKKSSKTGNNMMGDQKFAKEAAQGGMAEVKLGQLAQEKASSDAVKNFGKRMVDDHSKAGDKLKDAASKENITLPTDIAAKDQATYDRLAKLSGAAFDKAYMKDMVADHEKDVAAFQKEANSGKNDSLKSFASETLPTLQDHLKEAKETSKTVSGASAKNSKSAKSDASSR
jgi:putative membrane protein